MPTHSEEPRFWDDYGRLSPTAQGAFLATRDRFVASLRSQRFGPALRLKRVQGHDRVWELTFAPDGRATFEYGEEVIPGEPHIIWRRIGTHEIFERP